MDKEIMELLQKLVKGQEETNARLDKIDVRLDKIENRLDTIETEVKAINDKVDTLYNALAEAKQGK